MVPAQNLDFSRGQDFFGLIKWLTFQTSFWGGKFENQPCFKKHEMSSRVFYHQGNDDPFVYIYIVCVCVYVRMYVCIIIFTLYTYSIKMENKQTNKTWKKQKIKMERL